MDKKTKTIVGVLVAVIVILVAFIVYSYYAGWFSVQQQYAYNYGYQMAILQIVEQSRNCSEVPLFVGNQTFTLIDVACK